MYGLRCSQDGLSVPIVRLKQLKSCAPNHCVVSKGGYSATVSGRTTCAPCKDDWPPVALVLTSAFMSVVGYNTASDRFPTSGHVLARLWTSTVWIDESGLIF